MWRDNRRAKFPILPGLTLLSAAGVVIYLPAKNNSFGQVYTIMKQYRQIFYVIGILILLAILGYFLADYSWDNVMDTLLATEVP